MTVATKAKQKTSRHPHISQIKFRQQITNLIWKFHEKHERLKKNAPKQLLECKKKIQNPSKIIELERYFVTHRQLELLRQRNRHSGFNLLWIVLSRKYKKMFFTTLKKIKPLKRKMAKPPSFGNLF